jgi:hypothetical protein
VAAAYHGVQRATAGRLKAHTKDWKSDKRQSFNNYNALKSTYWCNWIKAEDSCRVRNVSAFVRALCNIYWSFKEAVSDLHLWFRRKKTQIKTAFRLLWPVFLYNIHFLGFDTQ